MNSELFRIDFRDLAKGLSVAVIVVVLGAIQQAFQTHGLDFSAFDWVGILNVAWKATAAYLAKNFISTPDGKVLGRIG